MSPVYQTFQAIGEREDLSDLIVNITPSETALFSAMAKVNATGILHEWQTDTLATAATNEQIEGADPTFPTLSPTTRLGNTIQRMWKPFFVSNEIEAVSKAGRESEYAYQLEKAMKELARDTEFDNWRNASAAGASGTAKALQGVDNSLSTNTSTAGSSRALSENLYNNMLQTIFDSGGNPNVTFVGGFNKRQISSFAGGTGTSRNIGLADRRLINSIDVYEADFGLQKIILSRHQSSAVAYLLEMAMWRAAVLIPTAHKPIPDLGGGPRGMVSHHMTLEYGNEASSGSISNLTTS
ncbi:hypothetical protein LCGC14_2306220 [marine sediment metagenome]|uniref:Bacteriophage Mu GpT domain-containing protein n=1 Tax=marine sediment metagenome TaxID=412755 RepID=A0A0F9CMI3_9ZZZZ